MLDIKSPEELVKMRCAGAATAKILNAMARMVAPGVTPLDLDAYAEKACKDLGVFPAFKGYRGFPNSVCISVNNQVVHSIPTDKPFQNGDLVKLDFGVCADGYYGDSAVTTPVGEIPAESQKLVDATKKALDKAISVMLPGNQLGDVSAIIEQVITEAGFHVVPWLSGHGIGKALHEDPPVPNYGAPGTGPYLFPGVVFAIEPIVNFSHEGIVKMPDNWTICTKDNGLSAHFEHTVAVTINGPEILTKEI